jgi:hypothetical protein
MPRYATHELLDFIESDDRARFIREERYDGLVSRLYEGNRGNTVVIDISDELIYDSTAIDHLFELGMGDRVKALFPNFNY